VGFKQDLDDSWRKIVPFFPPDKFGGAGISSSIPVKRQGDTFGFPDRNGRTVTLPLPPIFKAPDVSWNSFKPWMPKGNAGGVRTEDLEWVFVDKGDWPVMTLFTLAYEPAAARGGGKQ
jgi:hypothetical protein